MESLDSDRLEYSTPKTANDALAAAVAILERRRHDRIELQLPGRYMLEDFSEYACETMDVSPGGLRLKASGVVPWGARVVAYIEGLGRVEGLVVRRSLGWFAISLRQAPSKAQRLASKIDWLAERTSEEGADRRFVPRVEKDNENVIVRAQDGSEYPGELLDISMEGAAVLVDAPLRLGQPVRLGAQEALVIRLFGGGAAVKFV